MAERLATIERARQSAPPVRAAAVGPAPPRRLDETGMLTVCVAVAAGIGAVAWWATGEPGIVPVTVVGGLAVAAAVRDHLVGRIPNVIVLAALAVVACGWVFVGALGDRAMTSIGRDLLAGLLLSGAPALFAVWAVAPRLIGGGDWKLLGVCGLAIGCLAPLAAAVLTLVGFAIAVVVAAVGRRRHVRLGPTIAVGYVAAALAAALRPELFGGPVS